MKLFQISKQSLDSYQSSLKKTESYDDDDMFSFYFNQRKPSTLIGSVGHVYIYGMLLSDATQRDKAIGATDYNDVKEDIKALLSQGAELIIFHFNSGGGAVSGCIELAEYIEQLPIPTIASVEGMCASAAYKLASATSYIIATKSSDVGNIGTISVFIDTSIMNAAMGINYIAFTNEGADYKSLGHLDSLTEDQANYLQKIINDAGNDFKEFVLRNRNITNPEVWKAAWFYGQSAIDAGLIDEIGDVETANTRGSEIIGMLQEYKDLDEPEEEKIDTI
jgi:capsid assembly protease